MGEGIPNAVTPLEETGEQPIAEDLLLARYEGSEAEMKIREAIGKEVPNNEMTDLLERNPTVSSDTVAFLIEHGYVEAVRLGLSHLKNLNAEVAKLLVKEGYSSYVKWVVEDCPEVFPQLSKLRKETEKKLDKEELIYGILNREDKFARWKGELIDWASISRYKDFIGTPEVIEAVKDRVVSEVISKKSWFGEIHKCNDLMDAYKLTPEDVADVYTKYLTYLLTMGDIEGAQRLLTDLYYQISNTVFDKEEVKVSIEQGHIFDKTKAFSNEKLLKTNINLISPELRQSVKELAIDKAKYFIKRGYIGDTRSLDAQIPLGKDFWESDSIQEALKEGILVSLDPNQDEWGGNAAQLNIGLEFLKDKDFVKSSEVQNILARNVIKRLKASHSKIEYVQEFLDFLIDHNIIPRAELIDVVNYLIEQGKIPEALHVREGIKLNDKNKILDQDILKGFETLAERRPRLFLESEDIPASILGLLEKNTAIISYKRDINLFVENIYQKYVSLKKQGDEVQLQGFIESIKDQVNQLISTEKQDKAISEIENYEELVKAVFPNHANQWSTFSGNEISVDRSFDLDRFEIKPVYTIDLRDGVEYISRPDAKKNEKAIENIEQPIKDIQTIFAEVGFDRTKMFEILDQRIEKALGSLPNKDAFVSREDKVFALFLESLVGRFDNQAELQSILIGYQFAEFEDIQQYLQGTRDRTDKAKNPEYAYFLELREFFADRLKDVERKIVDDAMINPAIKELLPEYYKEKANLQSGQSTTEKLNKIQVNKIGVEGGMIERILKEMSRKVDKKGNPLTLLEQTGESDELVLGKKGSAIAGMIGGEQKKAAQVIELITGEKIDPESINLDELNLAELLKARKAMQEGVYDEKLFSRYLLQTMQGVFESQLTTIDQELAKYQPKEDSQRQKQQRKLEGFITKNHTSAHARAVGGVCVSGDNASEGKDSIWNMPNYLQMVLRDAESKICQGLVLLHLYEDQGKQILTASFNPSSTYLYKVDETQLFNQLLGQLSDFAEANNIDAIAVSKNKQVRTNRTGGEFERAMDARIRQEGKAYTLTKEEQFSFKPVYKQKELDIVWSKGT